MKEPQSINEKVLRLASFLVVVLLLTGLFSMLNWIALIISIDFFLRGFMARTDTPILRAARALSLIYRPKPKLVDAEPKIFAAKTGFGICVVISMLSFAGLNTAARYLTELMVLIAGMHAFVGICIGCRLYTRLKTQP